MTAQHEYNGSGPPHRWVESEDEDGDVRSEVRGLKRTIGAFPDPLSGEGGSGICRFLWDIKREQEAAKARVSFLSTWKGRTVAGALVFAFCMTQVGSCVKLVVDWRSAVASPAAH